jgi:hypothetical protein
MSRLLKKSTFLACALLVILTLGACGSSHTKVTSGTYAGEGGKNAPYLDVGPLSYEVQLSRQLNPFDLEDSAYLEGLSPSERQLAPGQEWFAVFLQVYNNTGQPHPATTSLTISDTQGNNYIPVVPAQGNDFTYRAGTVPANGQLPPLDSVAYAGPTQGALLLYKIKVTSLDNRPLTLKIVDLMNPSETAQAELDV